MKKLSDIEIKLEQACKLLAFGKLNKKSENFVNSLKRKKNIGRITKRQYDWLTEIVRSYREVSIFKDIKQEAESEPSVRKYEIDQLSENKSEDDWFDKLEP